MALMSLMASAPVVAHAQDRVYRCGADGRSYSSAPCPTGQPGREVDVADPRSEAQRQQALQVAAQDTQRAQALRQERHAREQAERATPHGAAGLSAPRAASAPPVHAPGPKKKTRKQRGSQALGERDGVRTAQGPAPAPAASPRRRSKP